MNDKILPSFVLSLLFASLFITIFDFIYKGKGWGCVGGGQIRLVSKILTFL